MTENHDSGWKGGNTQIKMKQKERREIGRRKGGEGNERRRSEKEREKHTHHRHQNATRLHTVEYVQYVVDMERFPFRFR